MKRNEKVIAASIGVVLTVICCILLMGSQRGEPPVTLASAPQPAATEQEPSALSGTIAVSAALVETSSAAEPIPATNGSSQPATGGALDGAPPVSSVVSETPATPPPAPATPVPIAAIAAPADVPAPAVPEPNPAPPVVEAPPPAPTSEPAPAPAPAPQPAPAPAPDPQPEQPAPQGGFAYCSCGAVLTLEELTEHMKQHALNGESHHYDTY